MFKKTLVNLIVALTLVSFTAVNSQAQVFGLGDPILNRDFGAGSSLYGEELAGYIGANGEYSFSTSGAPQTGSYTIINNTDFAPAIWWSTQDNTPNDNGGYMLVVKPRPNNDQVLYKHKLTDLCDNTHYTFEAYFLNLSRNAGGIAPDLMLKVQTEAGNPIWDIPIGTIDYEPAGPRWVPKSIADFTLPPGVTSIVVSIVCNTPGGPLLNDLAIDDITVKAIGEYKRADFDDDASSTNREVCITDQRSFSATVTDPGNGNNVQWQHKLDNGKWEPIQGENSFNILIPPPGEAGVHRYRAASAPGGNITKFQCSVLSNELTIKVNALVTVSAGPDKFYLRDSGVPVVLEGSSNSTTVSWSVEPGGVDVTSLSSTTVVKPQATPDQTTTYILTATPDANTCGNVVEDRVTVIVADIPEIANAFTPNGDGINDTWVIGGLNTYEKPSVQVYNRYGQLLFRTAGRNAAPWDGTYNGKYVPPGAYYYIVDLGINGFKLSGSVTVLR